MIYNDGYEVDNEKRFVRCPRCGNEEYSSEAAFCRICGLPAYNECEGSVEYDDFGNTEGFHIHRNAGNARYCEYCGKPTMLFKEKILLSFADAQSEQMNESPFTFSEEDEELPFN